MPDRSGEDEALRQRIVGAIERVVPSKVVTWPTPYDRRYGDLDQQDRFAIVEGGADAVLDALGLEQVGWEHPHGNVWGMGPSPAVVERLRLSPVYAARHIARDSAP